MPRKELVTIHSGPAAMEGMFETPDDPTGLVLFAHGSGSSRHSPRNNYVASRLRDAGMGTLLLDLLTPLEDRQAENRFNIPLLTHRLRDAAAWLRLNSTPVGARVGLFGASTGAAAALQLAADDAGIAAVVSRGGRPDLAGHPALAAVSSPTLLIVGGNDDVVIGLNRRAYDELHCEKDLVIVPGATHLFEEAGALERVADFAVGWFSRHFPTG
ncbi:MAG TPA: dienelactone hydrolase family protein [Telluria sp.]|nr:dienelactone hydrolase family protein [Telluria sp.]